MMSVLAQGVLVAEPVTRTTAQGAPFVTAKLRVAGTDGAPVWCSLIGFGDMVRALSGLVAGDSLAVAGVAAIAHWKDKNGQPRAGLRITVSRTMTVYAAGRQRKAAA